MVTVAAAWNAGAPHGPGLGIASRAEMFETA